MNFSGPIVNFIDDHLKFLVGDGGEISTFREVIPDPEITVFISTPLVR